MLRRTSMHCEYLFSIMNAYVTSVLWVKIFNEISIQWNARVLTQGSFGQLANGNPLEHSCLENPMDRGTWQATVHGVSKSQTWLRNCTFFYLCMLKFRIWFSHFSVIWKYKTSEKEVLMLILRYLSFHLQTDYSGNLKFFYPLLIQCLQAKLFTNFKVYAMQLMVFAIWYLPFLNHLLFSLLYTLSSLWCLSSDWLTRGTENRKISWSSQMTV